METIKEMQKDLSNILQSNLDHELLKALNNKGYTFNDVETLISFVTDNCYSSNFNGATTFYVNDIPFFYYLDPTYKFKDGKFSGEILFKEL